MRHQSLIPEGTVGRLFRALADSSFQWYHSHPEVEFNLVLRGSGSYVVEDAGTYELKPQTLIWLLPGKLHKLVRGPHLEIWALMCKPDLLKPGWLDQLAAAPSHQISPQDCIALDHLLSDIALDTDEQHAFNPAMQYAVSRAFRASNDRPPTLLKPVHPAVVRALQIMRGEGLEMSLSSLASKAGIASDYLSKLMVEHTGRTFLDWRNRIRLDRFIEIYRPGSNLMTLALDAGFGSYARFHAVFTNLVGFSPKEWARKVDAGEVVQKQGATEAAAGFGTKDRLLAGSRQRWASLLPLASPTIRTVIGDDFLARLAKAVPKYVEPRWLELSKIRSPTVPELDLLIRSLHSQDHELAARYGRLMTEIDIYSYVDAACRYIEDAELGPPERNFTSLLASLLIMPRLIAQRETMTVSRIKSVQRQIRGVLSQTASRKSSLVYEAYLAMQCHFIVMREAVLAVRASNDPKIASEVIQMMGEWGRRVFGENLNDYIMREEGLVRAD